MHYTVSPSNHSIDPQADAAFAKLNENQLKDCLLKTWERWDRSSMRDELAPLLYHLRLKLRAPGCKDKGFEKWVDENLGIAIRTANRWASWYETQLLSIAKAKRNSNSEPREASSLGHVAETPLTELLDEDAPLNITAGDEDRPEPCLDEPSPYPLQIMLTEEQKAEFEPAMAQLGEDATAVIFKAVVNAANALTPEVVQ
jgi:hypothetical protein